MKSALLFSSIFLASLSGPAFSQSETVVVEGPRDPQPGNNPALGAGGNPVTNPPKCVDPTCGGTIEKPEPGEGGDGSVTSAEKAKKNKEQIEKAKKLAQLALEKTKQALGDFIDKIAKALEVKVNDVDAKRVDIRGADGSSRTEVECKSLNVGDQENPCIKIMNAPLNVVLPSGQLLKNLEITTVIMDDCYFYRKCPVKQVTFVVGSGSELETLLSKF